MVGVSLAALRARPLLVGLLAVLAAYGAVVAYAAACGSGGPPSGPTEKEKLGGKKEASEKIEECFVGDAVNCATGNLSEEQTDISIGGRGPGLRVMRSYNSLAAAEATETGPWGYGWTGPYSTHLEINSGAGTATVFQANGSGVVFYKSGSEYAPASWVEATFAVSGSNYIYTMPDQAKFEFNSEDELIKETEHNGNSNSFTYSGKKLEKVTDGDSRTLTFKYSGSQVESVTDPMGHVVKYAYESGNLKSVTIEGKIRWEFAYNGEHELTTLTDGRGHSTTNEYDSSHRIIKQVIAGHERKWKYGSTPGTEATLTEPNTSETLEKFNAAGEPTEIIRAKGTSIEATTQYEYNSSYQLTKLTDPDKHVTEYGYDSEDNRTSEKDPNGDEMKWKYNKKHEVETETTPDSETTTITRKTDGDPEKIERTINGETQKTEYKYDGEGDLTEEVNPLKGTTEYGYDAAGDRTSETNPDGDKRTWEYNKDSQVTAEVSPRGNESGATPSEFTTTTERDERGLPVKITDPLGHTTEWAYDGNRNVESETDGLANAIHYTYNEENLPTEVKEANGTTRGMAYDNEGKLISRTDGRGHTWKYERNKLEEITEETDPLGHKTTKEWEAAGNLAKVTEPGTRAVTYTYDKSNRLTGIEYSTETRSDVTFEYNKDSRIVKFTDGSGTTNETRDLLDRVVESKGGHGDVVKYKYNLDNEPTTITYPNGESVTRAYDKAGRLEKDTDWKSNEIKFAYNADSELEKTTFPTGTEEEDTYAYNDADRMTEVKMKGPSSSDLGTLTYTRNADGEVEKTTTKVLPGEETVEDTYDKNSRLIKASNEYEYDKSNDPTEIGAVDYTYNNDDELQTGTALTYTYNEYEQRTQTKPSSGPATSYGYSQAGNLTSVERPEEATKGIAEISESYTYNGDNLRVSQTNKGTTRHLTWDTAEKESQLLSDETRSYVYGPGNLPVEQITSTGTILYLHHDQQGSTRLVTNSSGKTEAAYTYGPYGTITSATGNTGTTPLLYDAQYTTNPDTGAELIYLRARTYDPATAQFLSIDPALETTGEPYAYTKDNPLNYGDLTGECGGPNSWHCALAKGAVAAATLALGISGTLLAGMITTAAGLAVLPPTVAVTVPSTLAVAGVTAASFGALVAAIRWELWACAA